MKISKFLLFLVAISSGAIAFPLIFSHNTNLNRFSINSDTIATIALFVCFFLLMVCFGWVKKVNK